MFTRGDRSVLNRHGLRSQRSSLNQYRTATAPGTGIEPATFWFRARRNHQQLLPRINQHPASTSNADKRGSKLHRCTSSRGVRAEGIEPIVLWLEARHSAIELRTHFQAEGARVELARHSQCSTAFEAAAITNWLALPFSTGSRNRICVEFPHRWLTATP